MSEREQVRSKAATRGRPDWFSALHPITYNRFVGDSEWLTYSDDDTVRTFLLLVAEALDTV
jgi:hypothetical protein